MVSTFKSTHLKSLLCLLSGLLIYFVYVYDSPLLALRLLQFYILKLSLSSREKNKYSFFGPCELNSLSWFLYALGFFAYFNALCDSLIKVIWEDSVDIATSLILHILNTPSRHFLFPVITADKC